MKKISLSLLLSLSVLGSFASAQDVVLRTCSNDKIKVMHVSVGDPASINHTEKLVIEKNGLIGRTLDYSQCSLFDGGKIEEISCVGTGLKPDAVLTINKETIRAELVLGQKETIELACDASN